MGCLVAIQFVLENPGFVSKLILVGPPQSPLPEAASKNSFTRAALARAKGSAAIVDAAVTASTSTMTQVANPIAVCAVRLSLLGQNPEAYAKACSAVAEAKNVPAIEEIKPETLVIIGSEDEDSPPALCEKYASQPPRTSGVNMLADVGHLHVFEDPKSVTDAVRAVL